MLNQVFISYRRENDAHVERVRRPVWKCVDLTGLKMRA